MPIHLTFNSLLKSEHAFWELAVLLVKNFLTVGISRVRVMAVIKLHDVEATAVYVEMDVAFFKIRCDGFPESYLGIKLFNLAPGRLHFCRQQLCGKPRLLRLSFLLFLWR